MADRLKPGQLVAARWQVIELTGRGALGEVYCVRSTESGQLLSLKLLGAGFVQIPSAWLAFRKCIDTVSALPFEQIAKAYDIGIDPLLTMPFVVSDRMTWQSLARHVAESSVFGAARWAAVLGALAPALDAAHAAGYVHRELTPHNLFIDPADAARVRVTDFGMAILRAALPPAPGWGGAPGWIAPEAAAPGAQSTPAMDVFALGLLTFFALTGRSAFPALGREPLDTALLWTEMTTPIGSASDRARELGAPLDARFDAWFARALAANPSDRFASVGEMASALGDEVDRAGLAESVPPRSLSLRPSDEHEPVALVSAQPLAYLRASALPRRVRPPEPAPPPSAVPQVPAAVGPAPPVEPALVPAPSRRIAVGALVAGGAVLALAGVIVGYGLSGRRGTKPEAEGSASASPSALAAASANANAAAALTAASSSAEPAAPNEARVTFRCTPPCDRLICDGQQIVADGGALLQAGQHYCVATAHGYETHVDRFAVSGAKPVLREIELHKIELTRPSHATHRATPGHTAQKCGTFINPCK
jgi:eukaryotic-like serine/threonine-protein kinase